jgi:hypothetical protein
MLSLAGSGWSLTNTLLLGTLRYCLGMSFEVGSVGLKAVEFVEVGAAFFTSPTLSSNLPKSLKPQGIYPKRRRCLLISPGSIPEFKSEF